MRFRRYADLLIALGAGLLLGATFLDLLPEALGLGVQFGFSLANLLGLLLLCFLIFYAADVAIASLEKRLLTQERGWLVNRMAAIMFIFHSFRDGMAIGAAYAASHGAGYAVACGIAAHDLGDGMNTVLLTTQGKVPRRSDYLWLLADAVAPVLGGLLTFWWLVSSRGSVILLLIAAGFFLQIATGDFLAHARRNERSKFIVLGCIAAGALLIYAANLLLQRHHTI